MNNKYINKNTYEIVDDVFEVDEDIADTISILNKKGYYTLYSCSGHVKDPRLYEKYENYIYDDVPNSYKVDVTKDGYNLLKPYTYTYIYILFDKDYNFVNLPKGFNKTDKILEKTIEYYNENIKKNSNEIDDEIKQANKILLDWASQLPNLNI